MLYGILIFACVMNITFFVTHEEFYTPKREIFGREESAKYKVSILKTSEKMGPARLHSG